MVGGRLAVLQLLGEGYTGAVGRELPLRHRNRNRRGGHRIAGVAGGGDTVPIFQSSGLPVFQSSRWAAKASKHRAADGGGGRQGQRRMLWHKVAKGACENAYKCTWDHVVCGAPGQKD